LAFLSYWYRNKKFADALLTGVKSARAASLIPDANPAALHLTAELQQPKHYTPYAAITQYSLELLMMGI